MADSNTNEITISERDQGECSNPTVEIKIKTLDSQTYTLRVNKCVPVPALKEQIATVTGVLSEQQRLICRGKVLKDDQLLSAYHVEDGHTLHLVVRQPLQEPPSSMTGTGGSDGLAEHQGASRNRSGQISHSVVLGTFNIADQGDGGIPDVNRLVSAVLNSIGIGNVLPISPGIANGSNMIAQGTGFEVQQRVTNASGRLDANQMQSDHVSDVQSDPVHGSFHFSPPSLLRPLNQATVIPDSLTTLSQYLNHVRNEFALNSFENQSQATTHGSEAEALGSASDLLLVSGNLPTPAALGAVIRCTQHLLTEWAGSSLSQLARHLEGEATVIDTMARAEIQSAAMRNGIIMQNLGALLLELARTTMTLRMGHSSAESVVNAGPAVFVSTTGPNPLMVQALPFQSVSSFGAIPIVASHPGVAGTAGRVSPGDVLRNIDIHIRTGSSLAPGASSEQGERGSVQQVEGQGNRVGTVQGGVSGQGVSSILGENDAVRVVPVRTVVATVPAAINGDASSGIDIAHQQFPPSVPLSTIRDQGQVQPSTPTDRSWEEVEQANTSVDATSAGEAEPSVDGVLQSQAGSITEQGISQQRTSGAHVYSIHLGPRNMQRDNDQRNGGISVSEGGTLTQLSTGDGQLFTGMVSEGQTGTVRGGSGDIMSHILHNSARSNISRLIAEQTGTPVAISDGVLQALRNPFPSSQLQMIEQLGERSQNLSEIYSGLDGENGMVDYSGLLQRLIPSISHVAGRESDTSASRRGAEAQTKASNSEGPSSSYGGEAQPRASSDVQCSAERNGAEIPKTQIDTDNGNANESFQSDAQRQRSDQSDDDYPGGSPASKRRKV